MKCIQVEAAIIVSKILQQLFIGKILAIFHPPLIIQQKVEHFESEISSVLHFFLLFFILFQIEEMRFLIGNATVPES